VAKRVAQATDAIEQLKGVFSLADLTLHVFRKSVRPIAFPLCRSNPLEETLLLWTIRGEHRRSPVVAIASEPLIVHGPCPNLTQGDGLRFGPDFGHRPAKLLCFEVSPRGVRHHGDQKQKGGQRPFHECGTNPRTI
jgi:hypothetical protein